MLKKVLLTAGLISLSTITIAGTPYVGAGLGMQNNHTIANLFGGYGVTFNQAQPFYLGGEVNLNGTHYNGIGSRYNLGVSVLPGIMLSKNTMVYGRVGTNATYYRNFASVNFTTQLGVGLQTSVAKNWDVRGEYVHFNSSSTYNVGVVYKF